MATLTQLRESRGFLRIEEFAVPANISASAMRKAEKGEAISLTLAYRIADALGIPRAEVHSIEGLKITKPGHRKRS